jgi:RimJ/RimL family protein N-acetyltransferase
LRLTAELSAEWVFTPVETMTGAVSALTDFWFQNFPVRRISAEVFANNPASARVLEKAGFVFEGRLKNCVIKNRELLDSLLYAKTR